MKPETIEFIRQLLAQEVLDARSRMVDSIARKFPSMQSAIERFQTAFAVEEDFLEWFDEQK